MKIIKNFNLKIDDLAELKVKLDSIADKSIQLNKIENLNYFGYEIGTFSSEYKSRLKKNFENLSAIVLRIGLLKQTTDDLYLTIYPKQYKDETDNLLKTLNWNELVIPEWITGSISEMISKIDAEINKLQSEINEINLSIEKEKHEIEKSLLKIYNVLKLEEKIAELEQRSDIGNNTFALDVWVRESDREEVEKSISELTDKYRITAVKAEDFSDDVVAPTELKNNWFSKPFEMIVNMYGLPAYKELDPTPFIAVTFCLAFGIMFGDIGQGFIYVLAGLLLRKKMEAPAGLAIRLGASSMIFGCVYGSLFGLEQHELPWLPSLVPGGPLSPDNIPKILVAGVIFGVIVLSASYIYGTINSLKNGNIEEGIFGKNGIVGYIFFLSFIFTIVALVGIINVSLSIPLTALIISLIVLILKEPITNLVLNQRPLFHHGAGEYLTESIFEAIETILGTLSNSISFVRVGAFALNHAGLFLAFLVISRMMPNIFLEVLILIIGNILILSLEGLVVLIQSLRLHYYEMFGKFFKGGGVAFKPIKLN